MFDVLFSDLLPIVEKYLDDMSQLRLFLTPLPTGINFTAIISWKYLHMHPKTVMFLCTRYICHRVQLWDDCQKHYSTEENQVLMSIVEELMLSTELRQHPSTYLSNFVNLKSLYLPNVTKACMPKLATCVWLKELRIDSMIFGSRYRITAVESHHMMFRHRMKDISKLRCLELLHLSHSNIGKLTPLIGLPLKQLKLTDCSPVKTLNGIQNLPLMFCRVEMCNKLTDISMLSEIPTLQWLGINRCNGVVNVPTFKPFNVIKHLEFDAASLTSITFLANCHYLERLNLSLCTEVKDISALENCLNLLQLDISETNVENIEVVAKLNRLKHLDLRECRRVTSISSIQHCCSLTDISLTGVGDCCLSDFVDADFFTPLSSLKNLRRLVMCRGCRFCTHTPTLAMYDLKQRQVIARSVHLIGSECDSWKA